MFIIIVGVNYHMLEIVRGFNEYVHDYIAQEDKQDIILP